MNIENEGVAKVVARWVALLALFLITITPLLIADNYFFPFITGKAFFFRIIVEIAVCAWVVLAFLDKEYRPRFSWAGVVVVSFVAWMFIADLFSPNVAKAFWSNFERMEGWVLLVHLLGLFFAMSAVLRVEKKWRAWFLTSLGASLVVSGYALLQLNGTLAIHQGSTRIDATLGNSAYLAIYFLFNVFIACWLAFSEKRAWLKWLLFAVAVLEAVLLLFTETRGTILGFVGALALASLLAACIAGRRARYSAISIFVAILVFVGGFYLARNSSFVQHNDVLQRVASISLNDGQTRFTIWHMAFEGVLERPVVGWGQEGFNYVFNKYYEPSLYAQEQWFDRAHNAFIDWLSAGGVPAFLLYLALFGAGFLLLWRSPDFSHTERILLSAALFGYAVHNFFVFDNLYSYVYFFAILAFIDSRVGRPLTRLEETPELSPDLGVIYAFPIAAVAACALILSVNVPGMRVAGSLIVALTPSSSGDPASNIALFQDIAAHPSFAAQEVREQLVSFAANLVQNPSISTTEKEQAASLAVAEMKKQVAAYPNDAREHLELSYIYAAVGDSADALSEIKTASALSPKKEEIWIQEGATEWDLGDAKAAQADFNTAYTLGGPQFTSLALYAAAGDIAVGDKTTADQILNSAFGTTTIDSDVLAVAYYRGKDWPELIALWKLRTESPGATAQTWFSLASAYYAAGDNADAIKIINTTVSLYPDAASSAAAAIAQIKGKTAGK